MNQYKWNQNVILAANGHHAVFELNLEHIYYSIFVVIVMQRMVLVYGFEFKILGGNAKPLNAQCDIEGPSDFLTAYCGRHITQIKKNLFADDETQPYLVPKNLNKYIKAIDLRVADYNTYTTFILQREPFLEYHQLQRIIIHYNWVTHILNPDNPANVPPPTVYQYIFKDLSSLEYLEFTYSDLRDIHIMELPASLKTLVVEKNKYENNLDVHWCPKLEEINANYNKLQNIPILHRPPPPLKILRLKGNPLTKMTILDIAPLCNLTLLELEFLPNTHFNNPNSKDSYCQCETLKIWAEKANFSGPEKLACVVPKNTGKNNCLPYLNKMIIEAKKLRPECPIKETATNPLPIPVEIPKWMKYVGYISLLLLLSGLLVYLAWRSKFWQPLSGIHNLTPVYLEGEEEEEEMSYQGS